MAARTPLLVAIAGLVLACSSPPPPKPPEPEPPPPPPRVEKPKPKKCEALEEKCEGASGKKARVSGAPFSFEPASGWAYAQEEAVTIAQTADSGPAVALVAHDTGDAKAQPTNRDAAFDALIKRLALTPPKKKVGWKKPAEVKDVGELKISLYQLEGAARGDKTGPLLVFAAPLPDGKSLLGVGFVPEDDESSADAAILQSIESIAPAAPSPPDGAGEPQ